MLTADAIKKANENITPMGLPTKQGEKPYVAVPQRIAAFRDICPNGSIVTNILSLEDGVVLMKTEVRDEEGNLLAVGHACEKETSSYINKTSYIENCETSAVGRALGMLGIGIDSSIASVEEMVNAINNQNQDAKNKTKAKAEPKPSPEAPEVNPNDPITENQRMTLEAMAAKLKWDVGKIPNWPDITQGQYTTCVKQISEYENQRKNT